MMVCRPEQRKLDILVGDFVKVDLPYFDVCISNTPYQVSLSLRVSLHPFMSIRRSPRR